MKKRTIQKQAKIAEQKILEENSEFYNDIVAKNFGEKQQKRNFKRVLVPTGSIAAVIAIVLFFVFLLPLFEQPPRKHYLIDNEVTADSDLTELNSNSEKIKLESVTNYNYTVWRKYDDQYNDDLYFYIKIISQDTFEKADIYFYINPDYDRKKLLEEESIPASAGGFALQYYYTSINEAEIIYTHSYTAQTEYDGITIFIKYEQLSLSAESNFFNFFETMIKKV